MATHTYRELLRALPQRGLQQTFTKGNGGALILTWVVGTGALLTFLANPLLAGLFTATCAALAIPIARDGMTAEARGLMTQVLAEWFPSNVTSDEVLRTELERSREVLGEMARRIERLERNHRDSGSLERVLDDALAMVALQGEAAQLAEDLGQVLQFVERNGERRAASSSHAAAKPDALFTENVRSANEELAAAKADVAMIGGRLDTMLLQAFQLQREAVDVVRAEATAEESKQAVARLQDVLESRRRAATRLGQMFRSDGEPVRTGS